MPIAILLAAATAPAVSPGLYTNEEEVSFDVEAKRTPAPWIGVIVEPVKVTFGDVYGRPVAAVPHRAILPAETPGRVRMTLADGRVTELRKARIATCWGAVLKTAKKADGSDDWFGARALKLHDQGGRARFGGGTTGALEATLRMRNVIWPSGNNRPSLVLYVHTPEGGDRAVGYSWADKDAKTVGINLRWMQASCTIDAS